MNILYITHEYGDRWGKYATFLRELGHTVNLITLKDKQTPNQVTVAHYSSKYDIVWLFAADYIYYKVLTDDFIDAVKKESSIFVGYCTLSTKVPFKEWVNNYKVFDICFLHSKLVTLSSILGKAIKGDLVWRIIYLIKIKIVILRSSLNQKITRPKQLLS